MSTRQILLIITFLVLAIESQVANLTFQILSQGQNIEIPLEEYFEDARYAKINDQKSSPNYREVFDIKNSSNESLREVFTVNMQLESNGQIIRLSKSQYYTVKSIYNQPVKLFLLKNNFLMMIIYNELCGDKANQNQVKGFNLTQNLTAELKYKKISCTSMETQSIQEDFAYVVCRIEQTNKMYSYFIQQINLMHSIQGFIVGMRRTNINMVVRNTSSCSEYTLKYFQTMRMDNLVVPSRIFMFCKKVTSSDQTSRIYQFYSLEQGIEPVKSFRALSECLINSSYVSPIDTGFMAIINKKMYEYTTNVGQGKSICTDTGLKNISFLFAASRTYNNIQISYFFLNNNSVIIKSSYRTNYQKLFVDCSGFSFTSYALTQTFMAITLSNIYGETRLFIYEMQELYPRLIDNRLIQTNQTVFGNLLILSTSNYLEKGLYVFFFNNATNQLSLKEYNGFVMTIKPKQTSLALESQFLRLQKFQEFKNKYALNQNKRLKSFTDSTPMYTIYIQCNQSDKGISQYMLINIGIRKFNDSSLYILPIKTLSIDSSYINFNLSSMAFGPLQRFYLEDNMSDHNIHLQFINYFNTINIAKFLDEQRTSPQGKGPRGIQKVKQIALNLQLKVLYPVFSMYYSTFIQNCVLKYIKQKFEFVMECNPEDIIRFKSSIQFNSSKILVLSKDKWLQYSNESLQFCSIVGEQGQCQLISLKFKPQQLQIKRIKLVKFQSKSTTGFTQIQLFIICSTNLYYGYFKKQNKNKDFLYTKIFQISKFQVQQLNWMQLINIHYDKGYSSYLLLHLSTVNGNIIKNVALLYDHPPQNMNGQFLGHLIRKFDDQQIQSIMTIDNLLIILYRQEGGGTIIKEYKITSIYSVYETRIYPLYGRKIVTNGTHVSDGEFLYIETETLDREDSGKTEYLVFCPSLSTTNILTHVIPKQSAITFLQQIGGSKNKYPHSIGIHGKNIFALSLPNLILKFDYDAKNHSNLNPNSAEFQINPHPLQNYEKTTVTGNLDLKIVDYQTIMHEITSKYQFDISAETIEYNNQNQSLQVHNKKSESYALDTNKIVGPVMSIELNHSCGFLSKNIQFQDVLTKMKCLIDIDSKKYGSLLDMTYINFGNHRSVEVIITTHNLLCVQNREISNNSFPLNTSKACNFVSFEKNKGLFVCDEGQGTIINLFYFQNFSCQGLNFTANIPKPTWLIYQYYKMKFIDPFVVFEVPIRVETNKVYFLTTFDLENYQFSQKFSSITYDQFDDNFETKDLEVSMGFLYLLEDGLGIYDLRRERDLKNAMVQPTVWLTTKRIQQSLKATAQIVYIKPKTSLIEKSRSDKCSLNSSSSVLVQIGTTSHAYQTIICFVQDQDQYEIIPYITYKQYKDCKNNVLSKSKYYNELTIKLCILEMSEYRIFSNFMPITPKSSQYYMQFYSVDIYNDSHQTIYPFRMEKISTNDTFQIKVEKGELIVRSLFNFICYYRLSSKVKWTLHRLDTYKKNESQAQCNVTITLKNENCIKGYNVLVRDAEPDEDPKAFMPWIFRSFFMAICLVSLIKWRIYVKNKNIKLNKMRYNLMSNEFEFQIRLNSKKQLEADNNSDQYQSQAQYQKLSS